MTSISTSRNFISIIVIEIAGGEVLENCLSTLKDFDVECVVVLRQPNENLCAQFSNMRFEIFDKSVPLRRKRGVELASGEVVALIEDTTIPRGDFLSGMENVFLNSQVQAASGPISIGANLPARYQALGCTEYGRYHQNSLFKYHQEVSAVVDRLPGNFICYRRKKLAALLRDKNEGLVEGEINQQLLSEGASLIIDASLASAYVGKDRWGVRLSTRFHHGWIYGGGQADNSHFFGQFVQVLKSLMLPVVLSLRAIRYMFQMKEIRHRFLVVIWICLLEICWSAGELIGSIAGSPKNLDHWR